MMDARYITAEDIEIFYTGGTQHPFILQGDLLELMKTAGTVATTTTGILNKVYGALVWAQLNQEANVFGMLPKNTWIRSGWRVKTAMATSTDTDISISETASLPATVYPDIQLVYATPKIQVETFDVSDVLEAMSSVSSDDIWGAVHQVRAEIGTEFVKLINKQLTHKVAEAPSDSTRSKAFESIDRICSKAGEQGYTSGWEDVYGIDRDTASWANAYVNDSSTLRDLTDSLIRNTIMECRKRGANTNVMLTGYDTYATILGLYMTYVRHLPLQETKVQFGLGGVMTAAGLDVGINVASLYGIPLLHSVDVAKGAGTGEISYMYFLDTSDPEGYGFPRLGISVLRPVEYFETRDYLLLNKFAIRGAYRMIGEVTARFLYGQGKLRDIK